MKELIVMILLVIPLKLVSQDLDRSVIAAAGDFSTSGEVSISWTLGEVATGTFENESMIITQGFQQGGLQVSNLVEESPLDFTLTAYPNPVMDMLNVEFEGDDLAYQVVDINGKIIFNGRFYTVPGTIDFTGLSSGVYFLVVDKKRTHKIVKQ